ncbi:MAG: alginate export family protein [Acidobacteriaceae bacterium]|nr:alginate export family protein [Acidobacteriaceae bacterium]
MTVRLSRLFLAAAVSAGMVVPSIQAQPAPKDKKAPAKKIASTPVYADYPQKKGKVQPIKVAPLPRWLSFDMEVRDRGELQTAYNYTKGQRIYSLTRVRGGMTIRPTSFMSAYMQFHDTHALGQSIGLVASNMRDGFDLRQGYLELHHRYLQLIAGRQELKFGSERLIGISDWANNSRTFDAFRLSMGGRRNHLDLFTSSVVAVHPTSLDTHGAGLNFHGAYASLRSIVPNANVQPFVYIKAMRSVTSQQKIAGSELETTFGTEVEGVLPAHFSYQAMGNLQRGSFSNNAIHAGAGFAKVYYSAAKLPLQPRAGIEYDYATGNPHRNLNRVSTYDQLYPSNHNAFQLMDLFGFQNIKQRRFNLDLRPTTNLTLLFQASHQTLATKMDSLYNSAGSVLVKAPTAGFANTNLGNSLDLSAKYVYHESVVANLGVSHLFPGQLLKDNSKGLPETLVYVGLTYRFRMDHNPPAE